MRVKLKPGDPQNSWTDLHNAAGYYVLAIECTSETPEAMFWVAGDDYADRFAAGISRPDLIPGSICEIVDSKIPDVWITRAHVYPAGWRLITSYEIATQRGFLEKLTDCDPTASKAFHELVEAVTVKSW